jgi:hypothetical protein
MFVYNSSCRAATPSNTCSAGESTVHQIIRDHRAKTLIMRHYGNMQWVSFDVQKLTQPAAAAAPTTTGQPAATAAAAAAAGVRVAPLEAVIYQ